MNRTKQYIVALSALLCMGCQEKKSEMDASGVFEVSEVIVSTKVSGEIIHLDLQEGEQVEPGKVLGTIDTTQLVLRRDALCATLSATDNRRLNEGRQLASLRQQIENVRKEQARFSQLVEAKAASQKQLDDINYNLQVLERQLSATQEQVGSTNRSLSSQSQSIIAQIKQIDDQLEDSRIQSPIRGTILAKYAEQGEFATTGKPLFKVADTEDMKLRAYISAPRLTTLTLGQEVKVYADLGENDSKEYTGKIVWISDEAEFTPKTIQTRNERSNLVYAIKIAVRNDGTIKRGMYGDVKF